MFKDVVGPANLEDNPQTKLRSLMLKSIAGKRDIGQCEVSRLLLSEQLYHSSFNYAVQTTDLYTREVNLGKNIDENSSATKKSIIDFYSERLENNSIQHQLDDVNNLIDFVKKFIIKKNELALRPDAEKTVIITYPKV